MEFLQDCINRIMTLESMGKCCTHAFSVAMLFFSWDRFGLCMLIIHGSLTVHEQRGQSFLLKHMMGFSSYDSDHFELQLILFSAVVQGANSLQAYSFK